MDVVYALIPGMILIGLIMVTILIWAVKRGQYDDMDGDGNRILMDDDAPLLPSNKKSSEEKKAEKEARNWPDAD
ncbi:MAG: cbb3-type cytochrome oxidase assembly protein CcoS [Gammaproteobacteria bacterium]|nr:cbb3-type cytochrome oxidase assembly protein CcoS [Gammaproteobacteria bacterium]